MTRPAPDPARQLVVAGPFHAPVLAAVHRHCFDDAWSAAAFASLVGEPAVHALLATVSGDPVGLTLLRAAADEAEVLTLAVLPDARRAGHARALVEAGAAWAREAGCAALFLEVAESNAAARTLYAGAGFAMVGRRPGYYVRAGHAAEAALILRRSLITG